MFKWVFSMLIFIVGTLIGVRDLSYAQTPLPSTASCTEARAIAQAPAAPPGALTQEFIDCFEELLQVMRALLAQDLATRGRTALMPFLEVYDAATQNVLTSLRRDILPTTTQDEVRSFEDTIKESLILDEVAALQQLLQTPSMLIICDTDGDGDVDHNDISAILAARNTKRQNKKNILKKIIESIKDFVKVLTANAAKETKGVTESELEAIDEGMNIGDSDGTTTVNDARICVLHCTKPRCVP